MENKINKLVAVYARVSTARQEKDETIKTQLMAIDDYVKEKGYKVVKEYADEGWSGSILERPALDQLRLDAKNKVWEAVVVYDPDRIARDYVYQTIVKEELERLGIDLIFVTTPAPKTPEEEMLMGVKGVFSKYERIKTLERTRLGKLRKAREGHIFTEAPYGYRYIPKKDGKQGYFEINDQEAKIVKIIFSLIADEEMTIRGVVKRLQELGILPRESKRGVWNPSTLTTLLRNKTYIGEAHFGASYPILPERPIKDEIYKKNRKTSRKMRSEDEWIKIKVPAIIDEYLFARTQEQLRRNFELCRRNKKNEYLLGGKIYCTCGARRAGEGPQHGKHLYYRCSERVLNYPLPRQCTEKGVNARLADNLIWEKIKEFMSNPKLLMEQRKLWADENKNEEKEFDFIAEDLHKELEKLEDEEKRYIKAYGAEIISLEELSERKNDLRSRINVIKNRLDEINNQGVRVDKQDYPTEDEIQNFCQEAVEYLENLNFDDKLRIIRAVIEKVIGNKEELQVEGKIPVVNNNYVKYCSLNRHRGASQCRKIHPFSDFNQAEYNDS